MAVNVISGSASNFYYCISQLKEKIWQPQKPMAMKKLISLFVVACIAGSTLPQSALQSIKQKVGNPVILENWQLGELKTFNNVSVLRLEGENSVDHRTNVSFTSNGHIQELITCKAEQENLSEEEKLNLMKFYFEEAPGGQVTIFFDRVEKRLADPRLFTVEVIDVSSGETVFKKRLENEEPHYYKWGIWFFHKTINIPYFLEREFAVKVTDAGLNKTFKFHVSVNESKAPFQPEFMLSSKPFPL